MAAGSSTALPGLGSAGLGRGHQRTVSTQQPSVRRLLGCPVPSVSDCHHSHRPDAVLAVTGGTGPPLLLQDALHQALQLLLQDIYGAAPGRHQESERWKMCLLPHVPSPPQPTQPS